MCELVIFLSLMRYNHLVMASLKQIYGIQLIHIAFKKDCYIIKFINHMELFLKIKITLFYTRVIAEEMGQMWSVSMFLIEPINMWPGNMYFYTLTMCPTHLASCWCTPGHILIIAEICQTTCTCLRAKLVCIQGHTYM